MSDISPTPIKKIASMLNMYPLSACLLVVVVPYDLRTMH